MLSSGRRTLLLVFLATVAFGLTQLGGCRSAVPNRDPLGESFPAVRGTSLAGEVVRLPDDLERATVLLLGFVQEAQFDADRWLYGLLQGELEGVGILEVPTIPGLFPTVLAGTIDSGMRSGIPSEDWGSVVTVYGGDAGELVRFTGNERPRNIRVLLVDESGMVRWFHDRGFSAGKLIELERAARALSVGSE